MGATPLYFCYCYWNPLRDMVVVNFQLLPCKDQAARLRPSHFIARVVVLVFKLPEFLWIAEKN